MCGIVGVLYRDAEVDRVSLIKAVEALRHRGPDANGVLLSRDRRVGFGHARLAILDLTSAGRQPMRSDCGRYIITYNGEIYNFKELRKVLIREGYRFRSESDTEVLLASYMRWKERVVDKIEGMFAFAIHDVERGIVFLARDRVGEKPLYYYKDSNIFVFGSEVKSIFASADVSRVISKPGVCSFFQQGFVSGDGTLVRGVKKLTPGHVLIFRVRDWESQVDRYWEPPEFLGSTKSKEDLLEELDRLMGMAVRRQLVSDVPIGVLLSGGVDSSLITAYAARYIDKVNTFTVTFPGYTQYNEADHARLISKHFSTNHVELEATGFGPDIIDDLVVGFDNPIVDSSMIPTYLVSSLIKRSCTVALGGDGADELFGGYLHYSMAHAANKKLGMVPLPVRKGISCIGRTFLPVGFRGRNWIQSVGGNFSQFGSDLRRVFDVEWVRSLFPSLGCVKKNILLGCGGKSICADIRAELMQSDFLNYLPEDILVKVDRASMLNSLEIRAPMLDVPLLEFAFSEVPLEYKVLNNERKRLLKELCKKVLPERFDLSRKQGFSIPLDSLLASGAWRDYFSDYLLGSDQCIYQKKGVEKLLRYQKYGLRNGERLFALLLFQKWVDRFNIRLD